MYAIVFLLKPPVEQIENFRIKHDPKFDLIPAHITLVFPFEFSDENVLIKHIKEKIAGFASFNISISHSKKSFDNFLFLLLKRGNFEFMSLHDRLYSGILNPFLRSDIKYEPHLTIGYFEDKNGVFKNQLYSNAIKELESSPIQYEGHVNSVTLIEIKNQQNVRRFVKTFYLGVDV